MFQQHCNDLPDEHLPIMLFASYGCGLSLTDIIPLMVRIRDASQVVTAMEAHLIQVGWINIEYKFLIRMYLIEKLIVRQSFHFRGYKHDRKQPKLKVAMIQL